jgi:hypothetical protein
MDLKPKKTARFDAVVKASGRPEQLILWTKPQDNRDFMRAVKQNRVVTLIQHNVGTRKDYGLVGFFAREKAGILVFPKPIKEPRETKVVGIKYDRLAKPEPIGPIYKPKKPAKPGIPMRQPPSKKGRR